MVEALLILVLILLIANLVLQTLSLRRRQTVDPIPLQQPLDALAAGQERLERAVRDEFARNRDESAATARQSREELAGTIKAFNDSTLKFLSSMSDNQRLQLEAFADRLNRLTESNQLKLDQLKAAVEEKLKHLQEDNAKRLEQMRVTVDEKLQGTLEKRLGESFKQVSERLEAVSRGLGEMQTLATGVGDLKKVLSNVKARGTWGEVQLEAMLEQVLAPDQYETNVAIRGGGERVEFAIKLPGRGEEDGPLYLPIDVKWPAEDYQRLMDAHEQADTEAAEAAGKQLETRIKLEAKSICEKYIHPPITTDFAIMFLPTEGLFAEVVRRLPLMHHVQQNCRVMIAGPTTLWAILNSLQMGFKTLAIQKRSSEVWKLLAAVKTEFSKYGEVLAKVQKKLNEAADTIDKDVAIRTRAINRQLRSVQELPAAETPPLLSLEATDGESEEL